MAWIESHQTLKDHPKLFRLCGLMAWEQDAAIGRLHRMWWWVLDYAVDGDLRKFNDSQVALGMGVAIPEAKRLVDALVEARWLDRQPYFRVHDWWAYAGKFLQIKWKANPVAWQRVRDSYAVQPLLEPPLQPLLEPYTIPNQTGPDPTNQTNQPPEARARDGLPVELPAGFPKTLPEAISCGTPGGVHPDTCEKAWHKAVSRGGNDSRGQPIRNFASYLAVEQKYERERTAKAAQTGATLHSGPKPWELKLAIEAKEKQCAELRHVHCSEVAMGESWSNEPARLEHYKLKREIKALNAKIAAFK